mgnify:FL=1
MNITKELKSLIDINDLYLVREKVNKISKNIYLEFSDDNVFIESELKQILEAHSIERMKYYIKRLIKALSEEKKSPYNDLNLNKWKKYDYIITDSLWIFNKRDSSGAHNAKYWGNFIPQIPNQLIQRFTKAGETVLDPFVGSGTTLIEARRLKRNSIGIDISTEAINLCRENLDKENKDDNVFTELINDDSLKFDLSQILSKHKIKKVQLIILHPPYWDIIKFTERESDLSNIKTLNQFLSAVEKCVTNFSDYLEKKRHLALVIGDKYSKSEWIPLGFLSMQKIILQGFRLKSIIVKNFEDTTAKRKQKELWRYRALAGGYYIFKHEYIFIFQKI